MEDFPDVTLQPWLLAFMRELKKHGCAIASGKSNIWVNCCMMQESRSNIPLAVMVFILTAAL